tara:strand:- start:88 stop:303 length:216 start_codon:yes stop_codon:yes gene_type:complete
VIVIGVKNQDSLMKYKQDSVVMNDLGILANINNADQVIQNEVISLAFHCAKCGKFKKKNTNSIYCYKCLGL